MWTHYTRTQHAHARTKARWRRDVAVLHFAHILHRLRRPQGNLHSRPPPPCIARSGIRSQHRHKTPSASFPKSGGTRSNAPERGREVAAATAHSGSLRSYGFHGLLTRHGSTSKSRSAVGAGHSPMWRNLRLHGVPVEGEGSRFVSVPAQR